MSFVVADGKSISTKAGIIDAGQEVTKQHLPTESFELLVKKGLIVEKAAKPQKERESARKQDDPEGSE